MYLFQIKFKFGLTMIAMEVPSQPGLNPKRCLRLAYGTAQRVSRLPKMPIEPFSTIHKAVAILCMKVRID